MPILSNTTDRHGPGHRLGEMLCTRGLISRERLEEAVTIQRGGDERPLGEILRASGDLSERDYLETLARMVGRAFETISAESVTPQAASMISEAFQEKHNLLPLEVRDGRLCVAAEQFTDVFLAEEIARQCGMAVRIIAAIPDEIRRTRQQVMRMLSKGRAVAVREAEGSLDKILEEIGVDDLRVVEAVTEDSVADLESHATESPIVKLVNFIIKSAVQATASDIHIEPSETNFRVRFRVDGDLVPVISPPLRLLAAVVSRIKILSGMDITERRLPQDGGLTVNLFDRAIDLRISTMATKFGEKVVMRIVDRSVGISSIESIGMPAEMLERFRRVVREPNGMVLVTGPTGSGKSTTLYAALEEIACETRNLSTIEDPIERVIANVNQFQVHTAAGFSFAGALRSMLRQDPDVIMVGEIRDPETAKLATEAALTGHLVLSTLHTNDAPTAMPRLVNMGVEPYLVSASLRGVLAQRLCRRLCPECTEAVALTPAQVESMSRLLPPGRMIESGPVGKGCRACGGVGTQGRIGVFDLLLLTEGRVSAMLFGRNGARSMKNHPSDEPCGLLRDGLDKVRNGQISVDALLRVVSVTEELADAEHSTPPPSAGHPPQPANFRMAS